MLCRRAPQRTGWFAAAILIGSLSGCTGTLGPFDPPPTPSPGSPSASPSPSAVSPGPSLSPAAPTPSPNGQPTITILEPAAGQPVGIPFTATGTANTFEASLVVDLLDSSGVVRCVRHVTATSGTGTVGSWQAALTLPALSSDPSPATLRAYELSPRDGSVVGLVERTITVLPAHPAIWLTSPRCGAVVTPGARVAVTGVATVFEATLNLELRDAAGTVVAAVIAMTSEGGVESPFSATITVPAGTPSGFYDLVAFDISPKDGAKENEYAVQLAVRQ